MDPSSPLWAKLVIGRFGLVEDADERACELFGYGRAELLGMHGADLVPPDQQPAVAVSVERMREGELTARIGTILRKDGTVVSVEVAARPLPESRVELRIRRG
jgi:PAS domain S-box-containing protein